ncbi:MAG: DUF362 domain-containing protein [Acidobacteria bacterium]|nr:DUF362 domain-containing protein [Acidobacteriota bacterium]
MIRREFLSAVAASAAPARAAGAKVAAARCRSYGAELLPALEKMFDQLGGLGRLVKGKTVAMKVNLTGQSTVRLGYVPAELAHWTHPAVIGATAHLMARAGAHRIRILECGWSTADPLEEVVLEAGWDPQVLLSAAPRVEFENTNWLGNAKEYSRFQVPHGGHIFPGFELNHSYEDCDVFVSIAKMKEHATAGVTLAMKNLFGIAPATIYGEGAGKDDPSVLPRGGRGMFHYGHRQPSRSAPSEKDPKTPREGGYRVPRIVADLVAARPIHLSIIEGIDSMAQGEGPWIPGGRFIRPGVLVAGLNPVSTDAVCMLLMGFDPLADRGTAPFERCDSTLRLGEELGVGTRDLKRIEVLGTPIRELRFDIRRLPTASFPG